MNIDYAIECLVKAKEGGCEEVYLYDITHIYMRPTDKTPERHYVTIRPNAKKLFSAVVNGKRVLFEPVYLTTPYNNEKQRETT